MTILIITVHVIVCFVLILVILLQAGRGSGLSWGSFGGSPQSFLGTKSASFLAKATSVCAILFLITCITLGIIESRKSKSLFSTQSRNQKIDIEKIKKVLEQVKTEGAQKSETASAPASGQSTTPPTGGQTQPIANNTPQNGAASAKSSTPPTSKPSDSATKQ